MGPRTSAALREFQQAEGLRVTGRLDSDTRSKLGI
jgi:peptidoglycan hydrolase-like protein with peptidoglycan-binding domain